MIYTNMLFALALDKWVFGVSPGWWSLAGSGLILGSAVFVGLQREKVAPSLVVGDEERGVGGVGEEEIAMLPRNSGVELEDGGLEEGGNGDRDGNEAGVEEERGRT
jgi:hypothetical protein